MGLLLGLFCYQKLSIFEEKLCVFVNCIGNSADPILDLTTRNDFSWNCFLQEIAYSNRFLYRLGNYRGRERENTRCRQLINPFLCNRNISSQFT